MNMATTLPQVDLTPTLSALPPPTPKQGRFRFSWGVASWYATLLFLSSIMIMPLLWMLTIALKAKAAIFKIPPEIIPSEFHWENFIAGPQQIHFAQLFVNSIIITGLSVFGGVVSAMMAGYALARIKFPGRRIWFYCFISSMLLPAIVTIIPLFKLYLQINWYDTWLPLIVPAFLGGNPLFIFLARQYFLSIPYSLDEAAKMDGATHFQIFLRVMLPLTRPAWITMAILAFQASWNDYLNPLIFLYSDSKWPLSVGMASFSGSFEGVATTNWNYYMAANLLYMLPPLVLFFIAQRYFIQGLSALGTVTQK